MENINTIAAKSLGSANSYAVYTTKPDPTLLNAMPRALARADWNIAGDEFTGFDVWHAYEATFLLNSGQPVAGTLKLVFPVENKDVIESKSLKLYLNTYDMSRMGPTFMSAIRNYEERVRADLRAIGLDVEVRFFSTHVLAREMKTSGPHPLFNFTPLEVPEDVVFDDFNANSNHVAAKTGPANRAMVFTNTLRSRCRHTGQKDSGSAFLHLEGALDKTAVLKHIVSLREVNEFHEFCADKLFVDFSKAYSNVGVYLLYSRRGGIDIHPLRFAKGLRPSHPARAFAEVLADPRHLQRNILGQ